MNALDSIFNHRKLLLDMLLKKNSIQLAMPKLIFILEKLQDSSEGNIAACFDQDPTQWEVYVVQITNKDEQVEDQLPFAKVDEVYKKHTMKIEDACPL